MKTSTLVGFCLVMLLAGGLFFLSGFLVATMTLDPPAAVSEPQPTAWQKMSARGGEKKKTHGESIGRAIGHIPVVGNLAQRKIVEGTQAAGGATAGLIKKVPKPLQGVAKMVQEKQSAQTRGAIHQALDKPVDTGAYGR